METTFKIIRTGYGQYKIVKTTPTGKETSKHSTDSQLFDDFTEGKKVQSRLRNAFKW